MSETLVVYAGRVVSDNEVWHRYYILDDQNIPGDSILLSGRLGSPTLSRRGSDIVGAVYSAQAPTDERKTWRRGAGLIRTHTDREFIRGLQAADIANRAAIAATKNKGRNTELFKPLDAIHAAYCRASPAGKRALILDVLRYVQTGR